MIELRTGTCIKCVAVTRVESFFRARYSRKLVVAIVTEHQVKPRVGQYFPQRGYNIGAQKYISAPSNPAVLKTALFDATANSVQTRRYALETIRSHTPTNSVHCYGFVLTLRKGAGTLKLDGLFLGL